MNLLDFFISPAYAQAGGQPNALLSMAPLILMFAVLYFLMIRPQQKKVKEHREMVGALKKGDEVVTTGGIVGSVTGVGDAYVTVRIDENVEVNLQRQAVAALLPSGTLKNI